jgi:WD40 repeat protein
MKMLPKAIATALAGALALGASALGATPASAAPAGATHPVVVNTNPVDHTPHVLDGQTEAVLDLGSRVIVGGSFTKVKRWSKPEVFARSNVFAYTKATGVIDTAFALQLNGKVTALLPSPDGKVFVAGQFKNVGGVTGTSYLIKVDPTTGAVVTAFAPAITGMVYDIHLANGKLYVGGTFGKVRNLVRTNFAVLDPTTGKALGADLPFVGAARGTTRVMRFDATPDGSKLVVIGNFTSVGGQTRQNAAVLDLTSTGGATVNGWTTDLYRYGLCSSTYDTYVYDVDVSPDGSYFVIVTTGAAGGTSKLCDSAARWETNVNGPATTTWRNYTGGDSLTSVGITGPAIYVAGHQRWSDNPYGVDYAGPGALPRQGIAALDPATGKALTWNPGRERGLRAFRVVPTAEGLYVLSDSSKFAGEFHPRLTYLTVAGGTAPVVA